MGELLSKSCTNGDSTLLNHNRRVCRRSSYDKAVRSRKRAIGWSIGILVVAIATFTYFSSDAPFGRLVVPTVDVLAKYPRNGDGLYTMTHASKTLHYYNLKADAQLRQHIHDELTRKGFKPRVSEQGTAYTKSTGGLFPDKSFVMVRNDGRVYAGVAHSKWPQF